MSNSNDVTRRDAVKLAGAATAAAAIGGFPAIQKALGANEQIQFGMIGTGSRGGTYLLQKHLINIDSARCVALCDIRQEALDKVKNIPSKPKTYKDYRELLTQKDVDAVFVTTPLYVHFPHHPRRADGGQARLLREVPGVQAGGSACAARAGRGASQAGAADRTAAPLQPVLSAREGHGG